MIKLLPTLNLVLAQALYDRTPRKPARQPAPRLHSRGDCASMAQSLFQPTRIVGKRSVEQSLGAHMRARYLKQLNLVHDDLLRMGSRVEHALTDAMRALETWDTSLARHVVAGDHEIDEARNAIEEGCWSCWPHSSRCWRPTCAP